MGKETAELKVLFSLLTITSHIEQILIKACEEWNIYLTSHYLAYHESKGL